MTRRPQVVWTAHGRGPALVLINGWSASGVAWPDGWLRELERRFRVITLDNRGSGWSRYATTPFTIADLADDVGDVLDAAEEERAVVLGISMGGMIAQELALRAPERVKSLLLVATRPPAPAHTMPSTIVGLSMLRPPARGQSITAYFSRLWGSATAPGFADSHPELIDQLARQVAERPTPRSMLMQQARAMSGWGHAERLRSLAVPTEIVHGVEDTFSPVANGRALAQLIPGARYDELPGVGHLVAHEAPERLDEALQRAV